MPSHRRVEAQALDRIDPTAGREKPTERFAHRGGLEAVVDRPVRPPQQNAAVALDRVGGLDGARTQRDQQHERLRTDAETAERKGRPSVRTAGGRGVVDDEEDSFSAPRMLDRPALPGSEWRTGSHREPGHIDKAKALE